MVEKYISFNNGQTVDKKLTVFSLKASAHALCEGGQCKPGQRDGLNRTDITDIATLYKCTDITDIATLYGTTCDKSIIKTFTVYRIEVFINPLFLYII